MAESAVIPFPSRSRCEHPDCDGAAAEWLVDAHGCENRLWCSRLRKNWERAVLKVLAVGGRTKCGDCGLWFRSLESVAQVAAL